MAYLFPSFLLLALVALLLAQRRTPAHHLTRTTRFVLLLLFLATLGIGSVQCYWQLYGWQTPRFVRFYNRYNRRPNSNAPKITRGAILDRNGLVLVASAPGNNWNRRTALGEAGVHPLGYFNRKYGLTGVERVLDTSLSTVSTEQSLDLLRGKTITAPPVKLTLDARLQGYAYDLLKQRRGAVVILVPQTGELLALVSSPGFNPFRPEQVQFDHQNRPALNRAIHGLYPPGSTFKLFTGAFALEQKITPSLPCPAEGFRVNRYSTPIRDSEYYSAKRLGRTWRGWGNLDLREALIHSSNVYFAHLATRINPSSFYVATTNLFCPETLLREGSYSLGTARPRIPDYTTQPNRLPYAFIGQDEVLLTPLHVALLTATIANNGTFQAPYILKDEKSLSPGKKVLTTQTASYLQSAMRDAVRSGTAKQVNFHNISVCGKTGTAQNSGGEDHAWFTCFAPASDPKIVITVLVENGGFGAKTAAPIAAEILLRAKELNLLK